MKLTSPPRVFLISLLAVASTAQAAFITGSINFSSGAGGGIVLQDSLGNVTTNIAAATGIQSWTLSQVDEGTGSFDTVVDGTSVVFSQPWVFNPSTPKTPLWTIAGPENFTFNLNSSMIAFQNGTFLAIKGTGTLTGTGFSTTPGTWYFTTQGQAAESKFSWSSAIAAVPVPDGGATFLFLSGSLTGLFAIRRKFFPRAA